MSAQNNKLKTSLLIMGVLSLGACTNKFSSSESGSSQNASSSVSPWTQARIEPSSVAPDMSAAASCTVTAKSYMTRDEELRVVIASQGMTEVQFSVFGGEFFSSGVAAGTLVWSGNIFEPYSYELGYRGLKPDGTTIPCTPGSQVITIAPAVVVVTPPAQSAEKAAFKSLHQFNLRIAKAPTAGSYEYTFENNTGYKNQYNPDGAATGCSLGVLKNGICAFPWTDTNTVAFNFSEDMINYQVPKSFRFFVPSGATDVRMAGYAPQRTAFAYAIRFGRAPQRTAPLSVTEYVTARATEHIDTAYPRLAAGEEVIVVHDGGGTLRFLSGKANTAGGWVFVRQLGVPVVGDLNPSDSLYDIQLAVVGDKTTFVNQYRSMKWDAFGDPE